MESSAQETGQRLARGRRAAPATAGFGPNQTLHGALLLRPEASVTRGRLPHRGEQQHVLPDCD